MKNVTILLIGLFWAVAPAVAGGLSERRAEDRAGRDEGREPVDIPGWVTAIDSGNYAELFPGPDGDGYIGVGTGTSREEAVSAAAVDFAGNVSTEVEAAVIQQESATDQSSSFLMQIESEVRSQAIISGLVADVWKHPRSDVWYALYRSTEENYRRRLEQWIETMETMSEVNRAREVQRLEDERAEAERRREQIRLEELQQQVRLADRRMRADQHRKFLYHPLQARDRGLPSGYLPREGVEITAGFTGTADDHIVDGALDFSFWNIFLIGADAEFLVPDEVDDLVVSATGRVMVQLLSRAGWVTSTTLALGGFGTARIGGEDETEWLESGSWHAGPFGVVDVLIPEFAHTRYSLYAGFDYVQLRIGWYPFWRSIEESVSLSATGTYDVEDSDGHYGGVGVAFRPIEQIRVVLETKNLTHVRGGITFTY